MYVYILVWVSSVINIDVKCWSNNCFYALCFKKAFLKK